MWYTKTGKIMQYKHLIMLKFFEYETQMKLLSWIYQVSLNRTGSVLGESLLKVGQWMVSLPTFVNGKNACLLKQLQWVYLVYSYNLVG